MGKSEDKVLIILEGEIKTPPMSSDARIEAGFLVRATRRAYFDAAFKTDAKHWNSLPRTENY